MFSPVPLPWASSLHLNSTNDGHLTTSSKAFLFFQENVYYAKAVGAMTVTPQTGGTIPWGQSASFYNSLWMVGSFYTFPGLRGSRSALFLWQLRLVVGPLGNIPCQICPSVLYGKVRKIIMKNIKIILCSPLMPYWIFNFFSGHLLQIIH